MAGLPGYPGSNPYHTCQVRYMGMSRSVPVIFGTKASSVAVQFLFPLSNVMQIETITF